MGRHTAPRRAAGRNLVCSAWMVVGMAAGPLVFLELADWAGRAQPAVVLAGMFAGMVWGRVSSVRWCRRWCG